jgi:peptide/nickel transport system substrate-binding protein
VAWNVRRVSSDPKVAGGGFYNWMSQTLTGVETPDKNTTVLVAERSWPAVFDTLSLLSIIDPVTFEASGPSKPTGTGPFTFADYAQGDHFTLHKNPNYWQSGKPYLDGIEIKIFKNPQSMMTQLEAGAIDLVLSLPLRDVARLAKDPAFVATFHEYSGGANLVFAQMKDGAGPTTNKQFRQALNAAIDRKRRSDTALLGYGAPKTLPKTLQVIWNATVTDNATGMQIYQQDLARIGLTLTLKPVEPVAFVDQPYNSKFANLAASATLYGNLRPGFFAGNVYYSPFNNWSSFRSERLLQLTDGLLHETDAAKQKQIYADWMDYIQDESWAMPWSNTAPRFMHSAKVHGVRWNLADYMQTNDAWLST